MKLLFTLFFALFSLAASAQKGETVKGLSTPPTLIQVAKPASEIDLESVKRERDFYEKMYNQAKESAAAAHGDLLASLSVLASIVLGAVAILVGGQLFANYKLNDKQISDFEIRINDSQINNNAQLQGQLNRLFKIVSANELLININYLYQRGESFTALQFILRYAEIIDDVRDFGDNFLTNLANVISINKELQQSDFDRLEKIINKFKETKMDDLTSMVDSIIKSKPVYINNINLPKKYIRNQPASSDVDKPV